MTAGRWANVLAGAKPYFLGRMSQELGSACQKGRPIHLLLAPLPVCPMYQ